jgi:hypothetical protein
MQDELERNMKEMKLPDYDKPFFIMYGVQDQNTYSITSSLGSIVQSSANRARLKSTTRVLVGDYEFNDESLEDNLSSPPTALDINMPIDDDYMGIRRSLWSSTDKVYRDAARHFLKHQQTLKESGKSLAEIPHRSFGKGKAVNIVSTEKLTDFDRSAWEIKLKDLSAVFLKYPEIQYSGIFLRVAQGHDYLVNSEGVVAKIPFQKTTLMVVGQKKNADGEFVFDQILIDVETPDQIPSIDELKNQIASMVSKINYQLTVPKLDEEYTGPVLVTGKAVAHVFSSLLFDGAENIVANNYIPRLTGLQYQGSAPGLDNKIGKSLTSASITIRARPKLKEFEGVKLSGSFEIDDEGIVPPDELVIIENGILKNLMNDRTITDPSQSANGFSSRAGVLEVSIKFEDSDKSLKEKLLAAAKAEGLEYALIIRTSPMLTGLVNVHKVYVKDGREELVRNCLLPEMTFRSVRRILGASKEYNAYSLGYNVPGTGGDGPETSYIVPEGILFGSLDIKPFDVPVLKEDDYVSNPLLEIR